MPGRKPGPPKKRRRAPGRKGTAARTAREVCTGRARYQCVIVPRALNRIRHDVRHYWRVLSGADAHRLPTIWAALDVSCDLSVRGDVAPMAAVLPSAG